MDEVEKAIWDDVKKHDSGCWTWTGLPGCNIIRMLAVLRGEPLPAGMRMYRMPECEMGSDCVNPDHVGTSDQWMLRVRLSRRAQGAAGPIDERNQF